MKKTLLLNWVYYPPVGHVVEALKLSKGYCLLNPDIEITILINTDAPVQLAEGCPWIKRIYGVSIQEVDKLGKNAKSLFEIPKEWDYVITDHRARNLKLENDRADLVKTQEVLKDFFIAKIAKDYIDSNDPINVILPRVPNPKVVLDIPSSANEFSKRFKKDGPAICIMLGGSAGMAQSPTVDMWLKICQALFESIPDLKVYFTGLSKPLGKETTTAGFSLEDVDYLVNNLPNAEKIYNVGLWNQIALIKRCDIFLSPHTGFAFLAPLVDTPWLEIGTCHWPAYVYNDLPFYSVLPKCGSYPSIGSDETACGKLLKENKKAICVSEELLESEIPEIIEGTKLLLDKSFTYEKAIALHLKKIQEGFDMRRFFFFGGIDSVLHRDR